MCGLTGLYWAVLAQGLRWWLGLELPESFFNPISGTWNGWLDRIRSGEASLSLFSPHSPFMGLAGLHNMAVPE